MKPELESRRVFAITRSKGKMYEFGVDESAHIRIPPNVAPGELLLLTVGILGDIAASFHDGSEVQAREAADIQFAASFFDAFLASALDTTAASELQLLASAAYYLADRPGSSLVLARRIEAHQNETAAEKFVRWLLQAKWEVPAELTDDVFANRLHDLAGLLVAYFSSGQGAQVIARRTEELRRIAYKAASPWDLLQVDIAMALIQIRLRTSAWMNLPGFMGLPEADLTATIRKEGFPKELWPSQMLLGREGLFKGKSGLIQMPTSAGKTRSVEIILRGALMGRQIRIAVVVAPFRALCHEIATSLRKAFRGEDVKVNELSDALQLDFLDEIAAWFGAVSASSQGILILTPEKLLYVLRQRPDLVKSIGLVVYDEGHQFDSDGRGITYELLLTSLKIVLPSTTQIVLISAVIKNAQAVGNWLIGSDARIVNGSKLLPTSRSIAFASWHEALGQVMFYESSDYAKHDYFVPRVIEQVELNKRPGERTPRYFPDRNEKEVAKEVSLHLGLRLAGHGAVAIFCGRKDTASGLAERAAEIHFRGYAVQWPAAVSDEDELRRLVHLIELHFGGDYFLTKAARLGIFVHHGNTPHGLRICIESAMQRQLVRFVICTSTLAQGVNLPIRYLIVSSTRQADAQIKNRDFQNLMGRAGRAGMHTEGLVVFADPRSFDGRKNVKERWRFRDSVSLLDPELAEDTTSALLALLRPIEVGRQGLVLELEAGSLLDLLYDTDLSAREAWAFGLERQYGKDGAPAKGLLAELKRRRNVIVAVESFMMANRGTGSLAEYKLLVEAWAKKTLAYSLADDTQKVGLLTLFERVADHVNLIEPSTERQGNFAKTLLGVDAAQRIDEWVGGRRDVLLALQTSMEWLDIVWELLVAEVDDKFFSDVEPRRFTAEVVKGWVEGKPYKTLLEHIRTQKATKPHGDVRWKLTDDDVLEFLESTLGFRGALVVAAVGQSLFGGAGTDSEEAKPFNLFQKSLKYGLPDWLAISAFERGFSDREVALKISAALLVDGYPFSHIGAALRESKTVIAKVLKDFPSYFEEVLESL